MGNCSTKSTASTASTASNVSNLVAFKPAQVKPAPFATTIVEPVAYMPVTSISEREIILKEIRFCEALFIKYFKDIDSEKLSNEVFEIRNLLDMMPISMCDNSLVIKLERCEILLKLSLTNLSMVNDHIRSLKERLAKLDA
jgi:hypothetical protein